MKNQFSRKITALSLRVLLLSFLVAAPAPAVFAQKMLNGSHQIESKSELPKKKKEQKKSASDEDEYKATGQAAAAVRRQASAEAAKKAAAEAAAAEAARLEAEKKEAMIEGTYVDSTIYAPLDVSVDLSMYDQAPTYPGGMSAMGQFIADNLNYPRACEKAQIEGRVTCQLIIASTGEILDIQVVRGVHPALDTEAVRIIKLMPKWKPAMFEGAPVNCKYNLPLFLSYRD